jgi:hypothetical protein
LGDDFDSGERMRFRYGGEKRLGNHPDRGEFGSCDRRPEQTYVDLARRERLELIAGDHLLQRQVNLRQAGAAGRDQFRHEAIRRRRRETDLDRPGLSGGDPARDLGRAFREPQDALRLGQKTSPRGRQPDRAAGALQKRRLDDVLEHLDLPAQRRLGHVEPQCCPAEVKFFRHGDKTAELA